MTPFGSLIWIIVIGVFLYFIMQKGGGCCGGGHDHGTPHDHGHEADKEERHSGCCG